MTEQYYIAEFFDDSESAPQIYIDQYGDGEVYPWRVGIRYTATVRDGNLISVDQIIFAYDQTGSDGFYCHPGHDKKEDDNRTYLEIITTGKNWERTVAAIFNYWAQED